VLPDGRASGREEGRIKRTVVLLAGLAALMLASGAWAAGQITGRSIKDGTLTGRDIKNQSLTRADFRGSIRGPAGPQGPSGVVATLGVESGSVAPNFPGNAPFAPEKCRTGSHLAAAGEVAVVDVAVSMFPTVVQNAVIYGSLAVSEDGGGFTRESVEGVESMNDGVASVALSARVPLTAGVRYRFGAMVDSSSAFNAAKSSCHVTAMIVRS
jgi:hypothetical protein